MDNKLNSVIVITDKNPTIPIILAEIGMENSMINERASNSACGNCNREINSEMGSTCAIQMNNNSKQIEIGDALEYIYGISWNSLQKYTTWDKNNNDELQKTVGTNSLDSQCIFFCFSCATLLTDIYEAHYKLEEATNSQSVIHKMRNTREKIFNSSWMISNGENGFQWDSPSGTLNMNSMEKLKTFNETEEKTDALSVDIKWETYDNDAMDDNNDGKDKTDDPSENLKAVSKRESVVRLERLSVKELEKHGLKSISKTKPNQNCCFAKRVRKTTPKNEQNVKFTEHGAIKRDGEYFLCPICNRRFTAVSYILNQHMDTHTKDMSCHLCTKILGSRKSLRNHMKLVHNQGNLKKSCQICGRLLHAKTLEKHMAAHENPVYKCVRCGEVYLDRKIYDEHRLTHKKNTVPFLCRLCGRTFSTKQACSTHEQRHTGERKFACDKCPAKCYTQNDLVMHQIVHVTERSLVCEHCGKDFKNGHTFRRHVRAHLDEAENGQYSYNCDVCGRMCKNSFQLTAHKYKWHGEKKYQCSFCGKRVLSRNKLVKHENLHRNNPDYVPRKPKMMQNKPVSFKQN